MHCNSLYSSSQSNRFHACHALTRLRTSATSQIIGNQWFSAEKALRAGCRQMGNRSLADNLRLARTPLFGLELDGRIRSEVQVRPLKMGHLPLSWPSL